ncbi:PD-(D/E)XK nuclease family protein [Pyrobaculum calidifontis]|uniref:DUF3782 domain-containing protein n=1 Tax=Pyrobaculum calidifontis (strain DSM 21063 / JCM 11548 / VA1) TaxID=410359 RepID=A3MWE9_PYRCJ|nr:DUF3782 domain-containing protein [Pyrobaculum calidifontis]ABO08966.1 Protein of unknown function DUF1626 [Pyrobaculum calidifontis JCM 11548]
MDASQLKAAFLKLLKEDEEFRYTVAGYLGVAEVLKRLDKLAEEQTKIWKEIRRTWREIRRIWREIREIKKEQAKMWETINSVKSEVATGFDRLQRHLDALGARWGVMSEKAFREGLRGVVERELGLRVERWTAYDEEGKVFGFPSEVEVDVAVKDGRVILIEITSHARAPDVAIFKKKAELYAEKEGKRPDRLVIITPYAEEDAKKVAERLGVEIYTGV